MTPPPVVSYAYAPQFILRRDALKNSAFCVKNGEFRRRTGGDAVTE
jgi:hypothetical protein